MELQRNSEGNLEAEPFGQLEALLPWQAVQDETPVLQSP
jgi:hypothetical protein